MQLIPSQPQGGLSGSAGVDSAADAAGILSQEARETLRAAVARLDAAEQRGRPDELSQALVPVARCYRNLGAHCAAEDLLRQALRSARAVARHELLVDVLCELAETACGLAEQQLRSGDDAGARAARDRARDEAFEAASLTHACSDAHWRATALLRISDVLNRCGDHDDAACLQARALQWMAG